MAALVAVIFAGGVSWTLLEYCIHRWLGHHPRLIKNPFGVEHTAHHSRGDYFSPSWKKVLFAVGFLVVLGYPATLIGGLFYGPAFLASLVCSYGFYELLHRLEHVWAGFGAYGRWARRHHFYHHFHDPSKNHGVTTPLWDLVFGTYVSPGVIRVPQKLKMRWLCDPTTGDIKERHRAWYQLRQKGRGAAKGMPGAPYLEPKEKPELSLSKS